LVQADALHQYGTTPTKSSKLPIGLGHYHCSFSIARNGPRVNVPKEKFYGV